MMHMVKTNAGVMPSMIKVTKKHASGGQGINSLDPTCVTVTDQRSVTVTIKTCLATFCKRLAPGRAAGGSAFHAPFNPIILLTKE